MGDGRGEGVVTTARKSVTSVRREDGGREFGPIARIGATGAGVGTLGSAQAEGAAEIGEVTVTGVHGLGEAVHAEV